MRHRSLDLHPLVLFACFAAVLGFSMFLMHPLCLLLSLFGAAACLCVLGGGHVLLSALRLALPAGLLALVLNPLFNHRGQTILFYLPGGNPCTLESLCFGAAAAAMLIAVLLWFSCCTRVLTTEHFTDLFARVLPSLALLFSMTLRFLPQFRRRFSDVRRAQPVPTGKRSALRAAFSSFWAVVAWALAHAAETADSMNGRGYGLAGRTSFSRHRPTARDRLLLGGLCACVLGVGSACVLGLFRFVYAPRLMASAFSAQSACAFLLYALLCVFPAMMLRLEDRPWRCSKSVI